MQGRVRSEKTRNLTMNDVEKLLRYFHFRHSGKEGASYKILKSHERDNSEQDEVHREVVRWRKLLLVEKWLDSWMDLQKQLAELT